jgi:hypothetical protein
MADSKGNMDKWQGAKNDPQRFKITLAVLAELEAWAKELEAWKAKEVP